jgi:FixJ family two-component response regulator
LPLPDITPRIEMSSTNIISIVDDDESVRMALDGLLRSLGYTVQLYANAEAFLSSSGPQLTACLICDIQMPGLSGIQMYETLVAAGTHLPVIFITGYPGEPPRPSGSASAPVAFFPKPFPCAELIASIESVLQRPH